MQQAKAASVRKLFAAETAAQKKAREAAEAAAAAAGSSPDPNASQEGVVESFKILAYVETGYQDHKRFLIEAVVDGNIVSKTLDIHASALRMKNNKLNVDDDTLLDSLAGTVFKLKAVSEGRVNPETGQKYDDRFPQKELYGYLTGQTLNKNGDVVGQWSFGRAAMAAMETSATYKAEARAFNVDIEAKAKVNLQEQRMLRAQELKAKKEAMAKLTEAGA
jgi:hypothetical protein